LEALKWLSTNGIPSTTIFTDSNYAIQCTSKWGPGWKKAGWKRSSGEPLQNLDLVKPLVEIWKPQWKLQHVYGHQKGSSDEAYGNNWVDRAAVEAAEMKTSVAPSTSYFLPETPVENIIVEAPVRKAPTSIQSIQSIPKQQDIRLWFG
jgi:ribonuclease HI